MSFVRPGHLLLLFAIQLAQSEKHSLYYIYTALSKPIELPGINEFTAMGLLDDRPIDFYSSKDKVKVPKQHWMKENLQADYWVKGTQSRKSKEQWFKVNVNILMERMRQNNSDVHVLQWRHGCEVDRHEDGSVKFSSGVDQYSYDGDDFLAFDDSTSKWVAPVPEASITKRKWDDVPILNQYTKGYLEKECVDWLSKFMKYGDRDVEKKSPPEVFIFSKKAATPGMLTLTCLATGFYPKDIILDIRRYRVPLGEEDIKTSGVLPNNDETFQLRKSTEIPATEKADYDCYVSHRALKEPVIKEWDRKCKDCQAEMLSGIGIGTALGCTVTLLLALAVYMCHRKGIFSFPKKVQEKTEAPLMLVTGQGSAESSPKSSKENLETEPLMGSKESDQKAVAVLQVPSSTIGQNGGPPTAVQKGLSGSQSSDSGQGSAESSPKISKENLETEPLMGSKESDQKAVAVLQVPSSTIGQNGGPPTAVQKGLSGSQPSDSAPPEVFIFSKKAATPGMLTLTCLATGFYPKDIILDIRRYRVPLGEEDITTSGILPNNDETFQLRKSTEIPATEKADYDCYVYHRALKEPVIKEWDRMCEDCQAEMLSGIGIGTALAIGQNGGPPTAVQKGLSGSQPSDSAPPEVFIFSKKAATPGMLTLTCLATGFYPKDIILDIRRYRVPLGEEDITTSGILPNNDETFQLRKSTEIPATEKADYDCYVYHRALKEPVIKEWDRKCKDCQAEMLSGIGIGTALAIGQNGGPPTAVQKGLSGSQPSDSGQGSAESSPKSSKENLETEPLMGSKESDQKAVAVLQVPSSTIGQNGGPPTAVQKGLSGSQSSDSGQGSAESSPKISKENLETEPLMGSKE